MVGFFVLTNDAKCYIYLYCVGWISESVIRHNNDNLIFQLPPLKKGIEGDLFNTPLAPIFLVGG